MDLFVSGSQARGLHNFIADIRDAKSKDEERARVDKELANIRQKFSSGGQLNAYQKKKYVWKMCYIHMLGYDVDFGQVEFISLMAMPKYSEKQAGYMAASLLLRPDDEFLTLAVNSMRTDLVSSVNYAQTLALTAISNIGTREIVESVSGDVARLVLPPAEVPATWNVSPEGEHGLRNKTFVSKKACLCMLKLIRINPDCVRPDKMVAVLTRLLEDRELGVVLSAMGLITHLSIIAAPAVEALCPYVISILSRLVIDRNCSNEYLYYRCPCPWLQVKCLRFLQQYRVSEKSQVDLLNDVLSRILSGTEASENVNKSNAEHAILFEALNLIITYGPDGSQSLRDKAQIILGRFIAVKDANIRYLGLDAMIRLAKIDGCHSVQAFQTTVLESLGDIDNSVKKRALDLLYVMTDESNSEQIVNELVNALSHADSTIKEDIVVKVAILAEKYANDWRWYVDSMSKVLQAAGDFVAEAVWYRIVQIVLLNKDIHEYAAEKMMEIARSKHVHEVAVALAGYLLGEIGVNVCTKDKLSGFDQFAALHAHFTNSTVRVQTILLTAYVKFFNLYPDIRTEISEVFLKYSTSTNLEIQQRCCEYLVLPTTSCMENVLEVMAPYSGERASSLYALHEAHENKGKSDAPTPSIDYSAEESTVAAVEAPRAAPAAPAANVDLLSIDSDYGSSGGAAQGIPSHIASKVAGWFSGALVTPGGQKYILYEDDILRVTGISEYRAHQGRISFLFTNKGNAEITNFKVVVPTVPHLVVKMQDPAIRIAISDDARTQIFVDCMRPFNEAPEFSISFSVGHTAFKYDLRLPVLPVVFFESIQTDKDSFMGRWKSVVGEGLEVQEVFPASRPIDPAYVNYIRTSIMPAFHIGIAAGIDTDVSVTGSASLRTGTPGSDGQMLAVGCLMRLECNPAGNVFRITVRAKHPLIAQAVKNAFKAVL